MGHLGPRDYFGLKEALFTEWSKYTSRKTLPFQCSYISKNQDMSTKIIQIKKTDFLKAITKEELDKLLDSFDQDYQKLAVEITRRPSKKKQSTKGITQNS